MSLRKSGVLLPGRAAARVTPGNPLRGRKRESMSTRNQVKTGQDAGVLSRLEGEQAAEEPCEGREAQLADDLTDLRTLLERSDIEGARAFVQDLKRRWPESD